MKIYSTDGHSIPNDFSHTAGQSSVCILAHGITSEKTEGGIFSRQAVKLNQNGISTLQLDFVGHGDSPVKSSEMSIAAEVKDLEAVIDALSEFPKIFLLAASFGAVPTGLLPIEYKNRMQKICLWNPVLSLKRTFVEPELGWQLANFGKKKLENALSHNGVLVIDNSFEVGPIFLREVLSLDVLGRYSEFNQPMLVLHGDKDTYVSFDVARDFCDEFSNRKFVPIRGSEHGFGRSEDEKQVIDATTSFILGGVQ